MHHDRDINAALNILAAGLAVLACGANVRPQGYQSGGQLPKARNGKKQEDPNSRDLGIPAPKRGRGGCQSGTIRRRVDRSRYHRKYHQRLVFASMRVGGSGAIALPRERCLDISLLLWQVKLPFAAFYSREFCC